MRQVKQEEFDKLICFANEIFFGQKNKQDFRKIQPKVYLHKEYAKSHFIIEENNEYAAVIGTYDFSYANLRFSCIGTVGVSEKYRNKGLMGQMIRFIRENDSDILFLFGDKNRYQNYGFYKTGTILIWRIPIKYIKGNNPLIEIKKATRNDSKVLARFFTEYGEPIERNLNNIFDYLTTNDLIPYLAIEKNEVVGYICYEKKENTIWEICGKDENMMIYNLQKHLGLDEVNIASSISTNDKYRLNKVSDKCTIMGLANFRIKNKTKVLQELLGRKDDILDGDLRIKVDNEFIHISVRNNLVSVKNCTYFDYEMDEKEFHELLFSDPLLRKKYDNLSIGSWFPLALPPQLSTIDNF